jgi:hypothetical protein
MPDGGKVVPGDMVATDHSDHSSDDHRAVPVAREPLTMPAAVSLLHLRSFALRLVAALLLPYALRFHFEETLVVLLLLVVLIFLFDATVLA